MKKNEKLRSFLAVMLCLLVGILANESTALQKAWFGRTIMGGPMLALVITMVICNLLPGLTERFRSGAGWCAKQFLNWGIVATGATLHFGAILGTGIRALPLILINILLAFSAALVIGKRILKVSENTAILVGGGTCICGGTAIGTLSRIIKAREEEIAFAMAAIFLFDTLAAFSYPYIGHALGLTDNQFAFLAGAAINDTSSVAGAQATWQGITGNAGFSGALNVKLVRTTMLIFVALAWTLIMAGRAGGQREAGSSPWSVVRRTFPMFILWFVIMAALNTLGLFPQTVTDLLGKLAKYLFAAALAGVGFKIRFRDVFSRGCKPVLLGGITWVCVAAASFAFLFCFPGYVG